MTIHQNLIAGEWVGSDASKNINPSNTDDVIGEYARATVEDTKAAIAAAKAAFPAWSRSGILERHAILRKTADEILARKDELGRLLSREEGKTLAEGIGETVRAGQIFDFFAGECLRLAGGGQLVEAVLARGDDVLQQRHTETEGLARAGLGLANDVVALHGHRQRHGLDGEGGGDAGVGKGFHNEGVHAKIGEGLLGHRVLIRE